MRPPTPRLPRPFARITPRRARRVRAAHPWASALAVAALALAAACGSDDGPTVTAGWSAEALGRAAKDQSYNAQLINSQVGTGPARLAFGVFDRDGGLVHHAEGRVTLVTLTGDDGDGAAEAGRYELTPISLEEETEHTHADGKKEKHTDAIATVYVAYPELGRSEWWGAELELQLDGKVERLRTRFFVQPQTSEPAIGAAVPRSTQRVLRDVRDVSEIDSSNPPRPELHQLTVAEAIASGRPSLVAFATPAFCRTRFCGPVVDAVVVPLAARYAGRANFLHIEPYDLAQARGSGRLVPIPELEQWGLTTEPYLFLLDGTGRVVAKFEGVTSADEVGAALRRLLGE